MADDVPAVDYVDHTEYVDMEAAFFRDIQALLRTRIVCNIRYWKRWPYLVALDCRAFVVPMMLRLTKGQGEPWCDAVVRGMETVLTEVILGAMAMARHLGNVVDDKNLRLVASDSATRLVAAAVHPLMAKNFIYVPSPLDGRLPADLQRRSVVLSWPQVFAVRLAVAMGGHSRLGEASPLHRLDEPLLIHIITRVYAPEWPFFEL